MEVAAVPVYTRLELTFTAAREYDNPVQEAAARVVFTAPSGQEYPVRMFWDGGCTWRVRFSPEERGPWRYASVSVHDTGLDGHTGGFTCVPYRGRNRLYRRGPVHVAAGGRHFACADGTPWFLLSDTVWCGPALAAAADWRRFLADRVRKGFTGIQFVAAKWRMAARDADGNMSYDGTERIRLFPPFFQRLDRFVDAINAAGLVGLPVLLWAVESRDPHTRALDPGTALPEDQQIVLARYLVARYGAHQVMWLLGGDGTYNDQRAEQWKRIGRAVFDTPFKRLASMHAGPFYGREFHHEPWFDFHTYQSGHGDNERVLRSLCTGPYVQDWQEEPAKPVVNLEPNYEGHRAYNSQRTFTAHDVRRATYWSILNVPPAGVAYGGQGIWGWHRVAGLPADHPNAGPGLPWHEAMHLPGSYSMGKLVELLAGFAWWTLRPDPELLA